MLFIHSIPSVLESLMFCGSLYWILQLKITGLPVLRSNVLPRVNEHGW